MVRCQPGLRVHFEDADELQHDPDELIHAIFFLASPEQDPGRHLRVLANIASRIDEAQFVEEWLKAGNEQELKEVFLRHDRYLSLALSPDSETAALIGRALRELELPPRVLIAIIHRDGEIVVPDGDTVLEAGDRVTVIGDPRSIQGLYEQYRA